MQRWFALAIACFSLITTAAADEPGERFPYTAFVAQETSPVRSGPGAAFYPVQELKRGDAVEVWRHDPDGWLAIRPPEGAFSWIAADFLQTTDGRLGTVVGQQVNVRVGTQVSELRDVIQVRLDDGEQVDILESRTLLTGDREMRWYKISPPAGEFRWIHEKHVVRHPNQIPADATQTPASDAVLPVGFEQPAPVHDAAFERLRGLPPDASPTAVLYELEAVLSQMVTAEPTAWHFAELQSRAEAIVERSETAVERSQARLFLGKVARFADIQKRYAAVAHIRSNTADVDRQLNESAPAVATKSSELKPSEPKTALDGTRDTSRYDGVGRLSQIVLRDQASAAYALTDDAGKITSYILPAPGVNLRQFVGLDVGINGIRGFAAAEGVPQITAKRIDVLDARTGATLRR